jgi:hypothetical protein
MVIGGFEASFHERWWRQAGFSGFAYRLAHLSLPRPLTVAGICLAFYFF